jgi:hypothetical protein
VTFDKDEKKEMDRNTFIYIDESAIDEEFICSICSDPFLDPVSHTCLNTFCKSCLKKVDQCPLCRGNIGTIQVAPRPLVNMLDKIKVVYNCIFSPLKIVR